MDTSADFERLSTAISQRLQELHAGGPGDVRVARVHEIAAVRALRECTDLLEAEERSWLAAKRIDVANEGFGLQVTGFSRLTQEAQQHRPEGVDDPGDKLAGGAAAALLGIFGIFKVSWLLGKLFPPKQAPRSGAPLPASEDLILAAEAWLIAELCEERTAHDVAPLRAPWESLVIDR